MFHLQSIMISLSFLSYRFIFFVLMFFSASSGNLFRCRVLCLFPGTGPCLLGLCGPGGSLNSLAVEGHSRFFGRFQSIWPLLSSAYPPGSCSSWGSQGSLEFHHDRFLFSFWVLVSFPLKHRVILLGFGFLCGLFLNCIPSAE